MSNGQRTWERVKIFAVNFECKICKCFEEQNLHIILFIKTLYLFWKVRMYRRGEKYKTKPGRTYFFICQPGFPDGNFRKVYFGSNKWSKFFCCKFMQSIIILTLQQHLEVLISFSHNWLAEQIKTYQMLINPFSGSTFPLTIKSWTE
jgi:hypothetical protein